MKFFILVLCLAPCLATKEVIHGSFEITKYLQQMERQQFKDDSMIAILNDYADKLLVHLGEFMKNSSLDPMSIPDLNIKLIPTGKLDCTEGQLSDISLIERHSDVDLIYNNVTKKSELIIPLRFNHIKVHYHYHVKVLLLSISGGIDGTVKNLDIDLNIGFDFHELHANLNKFEITNSGKLDLHFDGHALTDWLINLMADAVSLILHPLILNIMENIIRAPLNMVVDLINSIIDGLLHPTTVSPSSTASYF